MVRVGDQEVRQYYPRAVFCHLVGFQIALPLDGELILPGEGELEAAMRLLERVLKNSPRFAPAPDCGTAGPPEKGLTGLPAKRRLRSGGAHCLTAAPRGKSRAMPETSFAREPHAKTAVRL